jgi:hypothetical protein
MTTRATVESCQRNTQAIFVLPDNPGSVTETVSYQLSYLRLGLLWESFRTHPEGDPVPFDATGVRIKATVTDGTNSHTDPGYGELACTD